MSYELPLGDGTVTFDLPDCEVDVARPPGGESVDPREAAREAVENPHGPRLAQLADPDDLVCVVVTDVTRATPDDALLDALTDELGRAGIPPAQVRVVVGLGLHRPMTEAELRDGLGQHADRAINHDPDAVVEVGAVSGPSGDEEVPIEVHPAVAHADLVLSTGMVEPHQYAGFSGGAKTVVIGAGGESFIRYTHGPEMLGRDGVRLGRIEDNPFREAVDRAGDEIGLDFCVNVTHGPSGFLGAAAGDPRSVVGELAGVAREALSVDVETGYDAVVAGVGAPKDANLYQTTRAFTYVTLGAQNPLRPPEEDDHPRVVVPAALPEGAGEGTGERRFHERLSSAASAEALYETLAEGYEPGAQRAFVVSRALRDHDLYVTDSAAPEVIGECLMHARETVPDAIEPGSRVLVVPDALDTLLI
jgi:nickel-dependent lactate racemase